MGDLKEYSVGNQQQLARNAVIVAHMTGAQQTLDPCSIPLALRTGPRKSAPRIARGRRSYQAGLAAEAAVARLYGSRGCAILARRWRSAEGEIDLIIRDGDAIAFVEVKARSGPIDQDPVSPRQWQRLEAAALQYMVCAETGNAPLRFDLAIVSGCGNVEVTKNARH